MENKNNSSAAYIDQLTWLKGIAAFFVIVSHSLRATEVKYHELDEPSSFFLLSLSDLGSFGVVLFFVLSGCTLYISNSGKFDQNYIPKFYIKRFFRIWPAFVISLIVYMCFSPVFSSLYIQAQGHWIEKQFLASYSAHDVINYITLVFNVTGPSYIFNNAYWSLPVEFQYYLIFPIIIAALKYAGIFGPIIIGLVLYFTPVLGIFNFDDDSVFLLAYSFCGGVFIGHIYRNSFFRINKIAGLIALAMFFVVISSVSNSYVDLPDIPIISNKWNWYAVVAIATVFVVLFTKVTIHNKFESFLKQYGTISYSVYLYHNLFIAISVLFIIKFQIFDGGLKLLTTFLFTLIASYIAALASYNYIEKPSISIGRKISTLNYKSPHTAREAS